MSNRWPNVRLGDLLRKSEETIQLQPDSEYRELTVRLWGKGVVLRGIVSGTSVAAQRRYVARAPQFILSRIDARNGALGIVPPELDGAIVSNDFPTYDLAIDRLLPAFLGWMCRTASFVEACKRASEGTTNRVRLKEDTFLDTEIPLPPLDGQRRVVARIEGLAAKINEARALRQQAREEADGLFISAVSSFCRSSCIEMATVGQLVGEDSLRNGISVKSFEASYGMKCLTLSAMRNGCIDMKASKPVPLTPVQAEPFLVRKGDVFVMRGNGSKDLCGQAGLVSEAVENVVFPDLFIRIALLTDRVLPEFFVAAWNSAGTRQVIEEKAKTTSGIWKINQGHISSTAIPFPPLSEQHRIVAELDRMQTQMDALKRPQVEAAAQLDAILPALLDRAFKAEP
ncbi:MAG: restriction endonuclease subunit S [Nitrospirae bacterium]|nr:restriction endonuclease subunit S [Nitrospirota bacterium]